MTTAGIMTILVCEVHCCSVTGFALPGCSSRPARPLTTALVFMKNMPKQLVGCFLALWLMHALLACQPAGNTGLPEAPQLVLDQLDPVVAENIREVEKRFKSAPESAATNGDLAMTLHAYRQLGWAATFYERARALDPQAFRWAYLRAVVLGAEGRTAEQEGALRAALEIDPDSVPARVRLARLLLNKSELEASAQLFEGVLASNPGLPQALLGLGTVRLRSGDATGLKILEQATTAGGPYGEASYALATAYRSRGEPEKAEPHFAMFEKARNQEPRLPDPLLDEVKGKNQSRQGHMNRALRLLQDGQMQGAAEEFELVLQRDPGDAAAHIYLVAVYGELNRFADAEAHYQQALALDPTRARLHYNFGVLQLKQRRFAEASEAFKRAIGLDESYLNAYLNLGVSLEASGRHDAAAEQYRLALAREPDNRSAGYFLGRVLLRTGDYSAAATQLERVLDPVDARTPDYLLALARAYAGLNDNERAQDALERALQVAKRTGRDDVLRSLSTVTRPLPETPAADGGQP